ncbi:MAG: cbb3-type cytochrome c oxidase subunit 3 [Burkholderiales bacterium]|nr:cbb3-type cytochrome c oxidase subunit 3 [Burkholderiales bacterium]
MMIAWLTNPSNAKSLALVIFFVTFVAIVLWVYGSKQRGKKLESYKNIPFLDEEADTKSAAGDKESKL